MEYIELEAKKARRRGQEFNWETATYGKVRYFDDIDYFKDFENEYPSIVYNDALSSESEVSSDFENEYPSIVYNDALSSESEVSSDFENEFPLIVNNDALATDHKISSEPSVYSGNDNDKVNIGLPSDDASIKPSDSIINDNVDINSHEFDESFERMMTYTVNLSL
uniref:Uncharacterized protein n=1 Tax=Tanacetum cinerariifolium TaxID=118510 RepID=A0A6L2JE25_TANCI|nr:hypothetical protein [Tanacetum cinerariifolium]